MIKHIDTSEQRLFVRKPFFHYKNDLTNYIEFVYDAKKHFFQTNDTKLLYF